MRVMGIHNLLKSCSQQIVGIETFVSVNMEPIPGAFMMFFYQLVMPFFFFF